jgi:hypothetical protein
MIHSLDGLMIKLMPKGCNYIMGSRIESQDIDQRSNSMIFVKRYSICFYRPSSGISHPSLVVGLLNANGILKSSTKSNAMFCNREKVNR